MSSWRALLSGGRGRILAFCWLGWVFDFYDLILFAFLKVDVARDLGLALETQIAWIDGWTLLATAVGGFVLGRLADRTGRRRAMALGILVFSAGAGATAFADGFWSLLAARVLTGLGVGGEWGIAHAVVAETYPDHQRGRAAAVLQAGAPVAMALAAAVGCFAGPLLGWRTCFLLSALPAVLAALTRVVLPASLDETRPRDLVPLRKLLAPPFARTSGSILLLLCLHMTGFWCTYAWLPAALVREHGLSLQAVGWFQIQVNAVHVVADLAFGPLAERLGRRRTFVVLCLFFAAGLAGLAAAFPALAGDWRLFTLALAAVGLGAGTWSLFGVLVAESYPRGLRATAASGFYNLARGVQVFTQPLLGALALATGTLSVGLWIGAATAIASAVAIAWVPRTRLHEAPAA